MSKSYNNTDDEPTGEDPDGTTDLAHPLGATDEEVRRAVENAEETEVKNRLRSWLQRLRN